MSEDPTFKDQKRLAEEISKVVDPQNLPPVVVVKTLLRLLAAYAVVEAAPEDVADRFNWMQRILLKNMEDVAPHIKLVDPTNLTGAVN